MKEYTNAEIKQKFKEYFEEERYPELVKIADNYPDEMSINIFYEDMILYFGDDFPAYVLNHPKRAFAQGEESISEILGKPYENVHIFIRIQKLPEAANRSIRDIRAEDLMKFITIDGLVRKVTEVRPRLSVAAFKCVRCDEITRIEQEGGNIEGPHECAGCGKSAQKTRFFLRLEESLFTDYQNLEVQESPEGLRGGDQPQRLKGWVEEDLVGKISPGDRITINGILDGEPKSGKGGGDSRTYNIFIRVNSIEIRQYEYEEVELSEEDKEAIEEAAKDEKVFNKIVDSISPTLFGLREEKMGLALQLFGGVRKTMPDGQKIRGDIHVLLVGDPGTAKSMLLRYISDLSPRGMYASGRGSTGAGLTAAAIREEVMGESRWILEAGTLVLADKGIAAVDELDKMRSEDRSSMHEAMEQQTISIAKAGINARLNSRCALLGAANPRYGRFEPHENISQQINLPPPLISRFDLIFALKDVPNKEDDRNIAVHILSAHREGERMMGDDRYEPDEMLKPKFEKEFLRKYVAYAKRIYPVMTEESIDRMREFYLQIRGEGEEGDSIPITARQLESLVRLSEASARAHLRDTITTVDAERAINVTKHFLNKVAYTERGWDIDMVASEVSHSERTTLHEMREIIRSLQNIHEGGVPKEDIIKDAEEKGISREKAVKELKRMRKNGQIYEPVHDKYKLS